MNDFLYKYNKSLQFLYIHGENINMRMTKYKLFKNKGIRCVKCGIEGKYFALEWNRINPQSVRPHFNLYGIDLGGMETMMTIDNIVPTSKGGINNISNYQTMCRKCNLDKGDKIIC